MIANCAANDANIYGRAEVFYGADAARRAGGEHGESAHDAHQQVRRDSAAHHAATRRHRRPLSGRTSDGARRGARAGCGEGGVSREAPLLLRKARCTVAPHEDDGLLRRARCRAELAAQKARAAGGRVVSGPRCGDEVLPPEIPGGASTVRLAGSCPRRAAPTRFHWSNSPFLILSLFLFSL